MLTESEKGVQCTVRFQLKFCCKERAPSNTQCAVRRLTGKTFWWKRASLPTEGRVGNGDWERSVHVSNRARCNWRENVESNRGRKVA